MVLKYSDVHIRTVRDRPPRPPTRHQTPIATTTAIRTRAVPARPVHHLTLPTPSLLMVRAPDEAIAGVRGGSVATSARVAVEAVAQEADIRLQSRTYGQDSIFPVFTASLSLYAMFRHPSAFGYV